MENRLLGKTGMNVSPLGYGGMELRLLDESSASKILNTALDEGINYIDTSPEYPMSEYYIGKAIARRRSEYILATKSGDNMSGVGPIYSFDQKTILSNLEQSLRLLKTDYVDVLQLHGVRPEDLPGGEYGEAMETLRDIKKAGKALHIGVTVCNKSPEYYGFPATYGYYSLPVFAKWTDLEIVQLVYGGLTRISENVIQQAYDNYGTGIVARGIMKDYRGMADQYWDASNLDELFEKDEGRSDFLIRFALSHQAIAVSLIGTKNIKHLKSNCATASKGALEPTVYEEAKRRLNRVGIIPGPGL
jgi:aryl-alcohol dehydrogenase-like predicted oxidoreductase